MECVQGTVRQWLIILGLECYRVFRGRGRATGDRGGTFNVHTVRYSVIKITTCQVLQDS